RDQLKGAKDPLKALMSLQDENTKLKKEVAALLKDKTGDLKQSLTAAIEEVGEVQFLAKQVDLNATGLKDLAFELGQNRQNLFLLLASEQEGKVLLSCYISKPLVAAKDLNASQIVRELGKFIQGGGGGQAFFATAGGKNPKGIPEALSKFREYLN
ncbi:DHHA1 domain-containing protein, partial [Eudoraea sp.]